MRKQGILASLLMVVCLGCMQSASAADYEVDQSHSGVQWKISHLGMSTMVGRFNSFSGAFSWDKDNPGAAKISVQVDTASIDSNWAERDKHLRGAKFLDVEKFPTATFDSGKFTGDASGGKLAGQLTMHGVTRAVTMDVSSNGEGEDPWGGYRAGFNASTTINRGDFGITEFLGPASETMTLEFFVEGKRK
jgi:polyisoprenoid-binding protein YceI